MTTASTSGFDKNMPGQHQACEGEGGSCLALVTLENLVLLLSSSRGQKRTAWRERVHQRHSINCSGELGGQVVVGHARVHLVFCSLSLTSVHQAAPAPEAGWGPNGWSKQEMSSTFRDPVLGWELTWGLVGNLGSPGNTRVSLFIFLPSFCIIASTKCQ